MEIISASILQQVIKKRQPQTHKGSYGRVALLGGNQQYGGAIILASLAAVHSGAGLVTTITHPANHSALHAQLPEAMVVDWNNESLLNELLPTMDVILIGPGLGLSPHSLHLLRLVIKQLSPDQLLIIDGSALTLLGDITISSSAGNWLLTPHEKEWQRVSGLTIPQQTPVNNRRIQTERNATIVLKKHRTEIYTPTATYQNPLGTPAMATGGMGDTLAGILAGFHAQFKISDATTCAAVYLHSYIAEQLANEHYVVLPSMLIKQISRQMKQFEMH